MLQAVTPSVEEALSEPTFLLPTQKVKIARYSSMQAFNKRSHANEMLNGLRYFERPQKGEKVHFCGLAAHQL